MDLGELGWQVCRTIHISSQPQPFAYLDSMRDPKSDPDELKSEHRIGMTYVTAIAWLLAVGY